MSRCKVLAHLVRDALEDGASVEIDGLGTFRRDPRNSSFTFIRKDAPKVFIAYVHEDSAAAERLFDALTLNGFDPWMDRRKLMPGQNWPRAIQNAMEVSDFAVTCFSENSVGKRGGFQAEVRYALDCAARLPLEEIFLVPVRLDECRIPLRILREVQYVDLFPDWDEGFRRLLTMLRSRD